MVEKIHIFDADFFEIIDSFNSHGLGLYPFALLPVPTIGRDFADVDFRVEICGKGVAMVAAVTIQDVDGVNLVKMMFEGLSGKNTGVPWVKTGA